jgi:serine protease AprX
MVMGVSASERLLRPAAIALAGTLLALSTGGQTTALAEDASRVVSVIVQGPTSADASHAVTSVGGRVTDALPIVDGVVADVAPGYIDALRQSPGVVEVTRNAPIRFEGKPAPGPTYQPTYVTVGSNRLMNGGNHGQGGTIALLDTGVYDHPDLVDSVTGQNRVIACADFTSEAGTAADCEDTFGHGTFMAGLMAGNGATNGYKTYLGTAPRSKIVSIKLAGFDGSSDVSKVLAGIQWAVAHKNTYGINIMNLSLGSDSAQTYRLSPLNYAVERAWAAGIVVVVSAGNTGPAGSTIMKPADDPFVITVGAANDKGTSSIRDDDIPVFSARGPTRADSLAKPDIVAPGVHTVSLRSPGSAVDQKYGATGSAIGTGYFKGTGTSMATASVSGVVAQMLTAKPTLTPDQVKARLMDTARAITVTDPLRAGKGLIDAYAAATSKSTRAANGGLGTPPQSSALGLLQNDRGSVSVELQAYAGLDLLGHPILAEIQLQGEFVAKTNPLTLLLNPTGLVPWIGAEYVLYGWEATNWSGTNWSATNWSGTNWSATNWSGTNWSATNWSGTNWSGTNWSNLDWNATNWSGTNWSATNWSATNWSSAWYAAAWD